MLNSTIITPDLSSELLSIVVQTSLSTDLLVDARSVVCIDAVIGDRNGSGSTSAKNATITTSATNATNATNRTIATRGPGGIIYPFGAIPVIDDLTDASIYLNAEGVLNPSGVIQIRNATNTTITTISSSFELILAL